MDILHEFGRRVRFLRRGAGMTQHELAESTGLTIVSISNIERGLTAPAFWRLERLAAGLNVAIHELFRFEKS